MNIDQPFAGEPQADTAIADRRSLIAEECFLGQCPFDTILAGLEHQFRNYMTTDDADHYVDIFYTQLDASLEDARDQSKFDVDDVLEVLSDLEDRFVDHMAKLFETHLNVGLAGYEDGTIDPESCRYILTRAYEYFILNAKRNFTVAISASVNDRLNRELGWPSPDDQSDHRLARINDLLNTEFNPIITTMTPIDFLKFTGDPDILKLFEDHRLIGNFLLRYTPRLYKHEVYVIELINHITSTMQLLGALMAEPEPTPQSETEVN